MVGFVYILEDDNGKFYIGSTTNIKRRLSHHKSGGTWTTSRMVNPKLVLLQKCDSMTRARAIEKRIKDLKRKDYIAKMVRDGYIKLNP